MALRIETFTSAKGGACFFKAVGHPKVAAEAEALVSALEGAGPVAVVDPLGLADTFAQIYPLDAVDIAAVFVPDIDRLGQAVLGHRARPLTELGDCPARAVFVAAFDSGRTIGHIRHLIPADVAAHTLDAMRLPDEMLTNRRHYLDPLNFATNFAFFRDASGHHTRLVTANYWSGYGARAPGLWLQLRGADGGVLAEWSEALPPGQASLVLDSRDVRARFGLGDFVGQLFLHVTGAAGHDVVKYALDTYGDDDGVLSCTHDANAWPAERYAGLPAPQKGERVLLWVQNSHPRPIPPGGIGINAMGRPDVRPLAAEIGPFATHALDVAELLPELRWPAQIEVRAGKHVVRPRYEVVAADGRSRIAHVNVERADLEPDPRIAEIGKLMGKGYLLPAPILPPDRYTSTALPTPMATGQHHLPVMLLLYDASGREVACHRFGKLPRDGCTAVEAAALAAAGGGLPAGYGHMELVYDLAEGGAADGWLHGLFRYRDRHSGHTAETSFGAHIFNTVLTYRGEPQSYAGPPPGLSTRLFLRLGPPPLDTLCHLIYPASVPWKARSSTDLVLHDRHGREVTRVRVAIPCSGSLRWRYSEAFDAEARRAAGDDAYVLIRDATCRLFGYHGLEDGDSSFSLDHMFGF